MGRKQTVDLYKCNNVSVVHHIDRKLWNRAVTLIKNHQKTKRSNLECKSLVFQDRPNCAPHSVMYLMVQIRQALLRHDWKTVHRLLACLLDTHRQFRPLINKVLILVLLSSPMATETVIQHFCSMLLGVDSVDEVETFVRTICKLPDEIPRGRLMYRHGKLRVVTNDGYIPADAFFRASSSKSREVDNVEGNVYSA